MPEPLDRSMASTSGIQPWRSAVLTNVLVQVRWKNPGRATSSTDVMAGIRYVSAPRLTPLAQGVSGRGG